MTGDMRWFAAGIDGFDRNKRENVMDAGCVYNFKSARARDAFVADLAPYIEEIEDLPCVLGAVVVNMQ
jgi:hypothetical protein